MESNGKNVKIARLEEKMDNVHEDVKEILAKLDKHEDCISKLQDIASTLAAKLDTHEKWIFGGIIVFVLTIMSLLIKP